MIGYKKEVLFLQISLFFLLILTSVNGQESTTAYSCDNKVYTATTTTTTTVTYSDIYFQSACDGKCVELTNQPGTTCSPGEIDRRTGTCSVTVTTTTSTTTACVDRPGDTVLCYSTLKAGDCGSGTNAYPCTTGGVYKVDCNDGRGFVRCRPNDLNACGVEDIKQTCSYSEQAKKECFDNDVYWKDSCGTIKTKAQECYAPGCNTATNQCRTPTCTPGQTDTPISCTRTNNFGTCTGTQTRTCGPNSEWGSYGTCNAKEPKAEVCGNTEDENCNGQVNEGCPTTPTCTKNVKKQCYNGDVYYYDSCNNRGNVAQPCNPDQYCVNKGDNDATCRQRPKTCTQNKCSDKPCQGIRADCSYYKDWTCPDWWTCYCADPGTRDAFNCGTCSDGLKSRGEEGVDCGGPCPACKKAPSCNDGIQNQGETGVDCGGPCPACYEPPTRDKCWDNKKCYNADGSKGHTQWGTSGKTDDCVTGWGKNTQYCRYGVADWSCGSCQPSCTPGTCSRTCGNYCDSTGFYDYNTGYGQEGCGQGCTATCSPGAYHDYDDSQSYCEQLSASGCSRFTWVKAGEKTGEYSATGQPGCCGDDSGENVVTTTILGTQQKACCASGNKAVGPDQGCYSPTVKVTGRVTNSKGDPISNAKIELITSSKISINTGTQETITNPLRTTHTDSNGAYTFTLGDYEAGTFSLIATAEKYAPVTKDGKFITFYTQNTYSFVMGLDPSLCQSDCTFTSDNTCHTECEGYNNCNFYDSKAASTCNDRSKDFRLDYGGGLAVQCCSGAPYVPVDEAANVQIQSENVIRIVKPVLYEGKLVKLVVDVFS